MIRKKIAVLMLSTIMLLSTVSNLSALENVERIKGINNYETAAKIADTKSYSSVVLINTDKTIADGLSAAALAGATNGVILLTSKDKIPEYTQKRIEKAKSVYLIGDEGVISKSIENSLKNRGKKVKRLGGRDRYDTSLLVAEEVKSLIGGKIDKVFIANGLNGEADIVSASPISYRDKSPILLTNGKSIKEDLKKVANNASNRYIIGGNKVVRTSVQNSLKSSERLGGKDRYYTNKIIIDKFYQNPRHYNLVDKSDYTIATVGCSISTKNPIVLINYRSNLVALKNPDKLTTLGNVSEAAVVRVVSYFGGLDKYNYSWTKNKYIAHALGGIDGKKYTNSPQALEYNYSKGHRVFEADIALSSDDELIIWHDFSEKTLKEKGIPLKYAEERPTLSEFKTIKSYGKYNTMSFRDLVSYMKKYKDIYVVVDPKTAKDGNIKEVYRKILRDADYDTDIMNRIIPQAYSKETYKYIEDVYDFKSMIFTCYSIDKIDEDDLTNFCVMNGIKVLTADGRKYTNSLLSRCNSKGIKLYMNTYNDKKTVDNYRKKGVYGFYTDFLTP